MRGQKYSDEIREQAYALYAVNGSIAETGRTLGIPPNTISTWLKTKPPDGFDELRQQKKREFIDRASDIIVTAMERLERELLNDETQIPVNHLTTVIGTLYDKRALAQGENTDNVKLTFSLPPEVDDYAG